MTDTIKLDNDAIDAAFDAQHQREAGWLAETSVGRKGDVKDLWADGPAKAPAVPTETKTYENFVHTLGADPAGIEFVLEDLEDELAEFEPMQRLEIASRLDVAQRLFEEGRQQEALQVAVAGDTDPSFMASLLRESDPDSFDEFVQRRSVEVAQESSEAVVEEIREGIARHPALQNDAGEALLTEMLNTAGIDGTESAEQIRQIVDASGRAADRSRIEEEHDAIRQAVEQSLIDTPGAKLDDDTQTREVWPVPGDRSPAEREYAHKRSQLARIGTAALTGKESHEQQVEREWSETIGQDEAQAAEWDQVQEQAQNAAAEQEAEDRSRGIV